MSENTCKEKIIRTVSAIREKSFVVDSLNSFTREELRNYARKLGVERGQNKSDTILNLVTSGKLRICMSLH